jgi:dihydrodipicolinate synthase/N-acetylneuraminate lyase
LKTAPLTAADLRGSVLAVPPMPRKMDGSIDPDANRRVLDHLRAGRVTTFMYGGNANFYNLGVAELGQVLDVLTPLLATGDWLIPAVGADFGKAAEQIALLRERAFPTAMVLPLRFPSTPAGAASGIGKLAARYGKPVIAYVKDEGYIHNSDLAALVKDGSVCAVKYAIVRHDPRQDPVLADLAQRMGPDLIVSGIGERPVIDHFRGFGLRAFTSGSTCVAPALSNRIREALHAGDFATAMATRELFLPLEDLRDAYSPIRVLHAAVQFAGIAPTGPIGEFLSVIEDRQLLDKLGPIALELMARNEAALARPRDQRTAAV